MMQPLENVFNPDSFLFQTAYTRKEGADDLYSKYYFEHEWWAPHVMEELLTEPWTTTKGDFDISRA
jgi:hypothetical protein